VFHHSSGNRCALVRQALLGKSLCHELGVAIEKAANAVKPLLPPGLRVRVGAADEKSTNSMLRPEVFKIEAGSANAHCVACRTESALIVGRRRGNGK